MTCRKVVNNYYDDVCNLTDMLTKLVNSYRLLIGGAQELNSIALSRKGNIKDALDRANKLGAVIDETIRVLDKACISYFEYCNLKAEVIKCKLQIQYIQTEIDEELKLKE